MKNLISLPTTLVAKELTHSTNLITLFLGVDWKRFLPTVGMTGECLEWGKGADTAATVVSVLQMFAAAVSAPSPHSKHSPVIPTVGRNLFQSIPKNKVRLVEWVNSFATKVVGNEIRFFIVKFIFEFL